MSISKLDLFNRVDFVFKTVHNHDLKTSILIPKALKSEPRKAYPTLVNWHGGGFVVGERLYEGWLPAWLLNFCLTNSTIFIAPDYRLLPEASGAEVLADVEDFWQWLHNTLPTLIATWNAVPDLSHLACSGQSAGGYLCVQSALLFPHLSKIKLLVSMGGSLHTDIPYCRIPSPKVILGRRPPPPWKAERIIRTYVKKLEPGTVRTSGDAVEMWEFLTCVLQQAYLSRWLGAKGNEDLDVMKMLDKVDGMPPIWLIHGEQDSVVPPLCTTGFLEKLHHTLPEVPALLSLVSGDHGFEVMHTAENKWVQEGLEFMEKYWL